MMAGHGQKKSRRRSREEKRANERERNGEEATSRRDWSRHRCPGCMRLLQGTVARDY